jgi:hypothetical protein
VIEDTEDKTRRFFLPVKNNLAQPAQGLAFRIEQLLLEGTDILASRVSFDAEPVEITANEALAAVEELGRGERDQTRTDEAVDFLRDVLAGGRIAVLEVEEQARRAGLLAEGKRLRESKVFRDARKALGVVCKREGYGEGASYFLSLAETACAP